MNKLAMIIGLAATVALVGCKKQEAPETGALQVNILKMLQHKQVMMLNMQPQMLLQKLTLQQIMQLRK